MGLRSGKTSKKGNRLVVTSLVLFSVVLLILYSVGSDESFMNYKQFSLGTLQIGAEDDSDVSALPSIDGSISSISSGINYASTNIAADSIVEEKLVINEAEGTKRMELRKHKVLSPKMTAPLESEVAPVIVEHGGSSGPGGITVSNERFSPSLGFQQILNTSPVILFIKSSEKNSVDLKNVLTLEYTFSPEIIVVDLDKHQFGDSMQEYIQLNRLATYKSNYGESSKSPDVPYLFINGVSLINKSLKDDILNKHADGSLLSKLRHVADSKVSISKVDIPSNS